MSISRSSGRPRPTFSPTKSIGASSRSPSPMTMVPRIGTLSIAFRIASTATWSEYLRLPCPIVRAAAMAASSATFKKPRDRISKFGTLLHLPRVDVHHRAEERERVLLRTLERVPADDRAEPAAVADGAHLVEHGVVALGLAAREDHDAPPVEGRLHDVADAVGERVDLDLLALVHLLRGRHLEVRRRRLHLHDVGAE